MKANDYKRDSTKKKKERNGGKSLKESGDRMGRARRERESISY